MEPSFYASNLTVDKVQVAGRMAGSSVHMTIVTWPTLLPRRAESATVLRGEEMSKKLERLLELARKHEITPE